MPIAEHQPHGLKANGHGYLYQILVLALCMLRSWKKRQAFFMETEKQGVGVFDDLVLKYRNGCANKSMLVQIKHKMCEDKKIHAANFTEENSEYNMKKLLSAYQQIRQTMNGRVPSEIELIYFTNVDFDKDIVDDSQTMVKAQNVSNHILKFDSFPGKRPRHYKFFRYVQHLYYDMKTSKNATDKQIQEFCESLVFAVNQPNEEQLQQILKIELAKIFGDRIKGDIVFDQLKAYIWNWTMQRTSSVITYEVADKMVYEWNVIAHTLSQIRSEQSYNTRSFALDQNFDNGFEANDEQMDVVGQLPMGNGIDVTRTHGQITVPATKMEPSIGRRKSIKKWFKTYDQLQTKDHKHKTNDKKKKIFFQNGAGMMWGRVLNVIVPKF